MGRQIQLFLTPEDVRLLEEVVKEKQLAILLDRGPSSTGMPVPIDTSGRRTTPEGIASSCYLVQPERLEDVRMRKSGENWFVDDDRSPVVEFVGGYFDDQVLRRGRLYYLTGSFDAQDQWMNRSEDFHKWAQKLFRLAKRLFPRDPRLDGYVGPAARKWIDRHFPGGPVLHVDDEIVRER